MDTQGKGAQRGSHANQMNKGPRTSEKRGPVSELQKGNDFDVVIEEMGHNGDGIAKISGYTVFVKNTIVGEKVKVKIKKVKNTIAFAERQN